MATNRYKIDWHHEWDRNERPFGVWVLTHWLGIFPKWKHICSFKTDDDAQGYIIKILKLPREIYFRP